MKELFQLGITWVLCIARNDMCRCNEFWGSFCKNRFDFRSSGCNTLLVGFRLEQKVVNAFLQKTHDLMFYLAYINIIKCKVEKATLIWL